MGEACVALRYSEVEMAAENQCETKLDNEITRYFDSLILTPINRVSIDRDQEEDVDDISRLMVSSLLACNADVRNAVLQQTVLFGGSGLLLPGDNSDVRHFTLIKLHMLKDMQSRICKEVRLHLPQFVSSPAVTPFNGADLAWVGGSIFASLPVL